MILGAISSRSTSRANACRRGGCGPLAVSFLGCGLGWVALLLGVGGCKVEREAEGSERVRLVTQVSMVRPAAERSFATNAAAEGAHAPLPSRPDDAEARSDEVAAYCHQVERQALETNDGMPKRLDRETSATRVMAYGCDIILEYAMLDLAVSDVAVNGVHAMRGEVREKLCADRGALGVMAHGGSFTSVYRDERSALIDQFTIAAEDCTDQRSAQGTPTL
jgi:hypothetical protein